MRVLVVRMPLYGGGSYEVCAARSVQALCAVVAALCDRHVQGPTTIQVDVVGVETFEPAPAGQMVPTT